jgi:hypothetical protein
MFKKVSLKTERRQLENTLDRLDMRIGLTDHEIKNLSSIKTRLLDIDKKINNEQ